TSAAWGKLLFLARRALLVTCIAAASGLPAAAQFGGELRMYLHSEPKTFHPLLVSDDASETIRYLTGGVLVRINRQTQALEPELASAWRISNQGRTITFTLRSGIRFSDGTAFSAEDVAFTIRQMMDPSLHSPTADAFRAGSGKVTARVLSATEVAISFPQPVAGLARLFD